jgi:hypothetical protein
VTPGSRCFLASRAASRACSKQQSKPSRQAG